VPERRGRTIVLKQPHVASEDRGIGAGLSVIRATAATVGGFPLFAVLVYVADEYPALQAGMGALET
jgi:hypothetical protein